MSLKRHENKQIKKSRAVFNGTEFKTRQQTLDWIDSDLTAAKGIEEVKAHIKKFEKYIVNTVFTSMGME